MNQGTFKKMEQTDQPLYGPRAVLVCGFEPDGRDIVLGLLESIRVKNISVIFAAAADDDQRLGDLLSRPDQSGRNAEAGLTRAIVLSGITENELHRLLSAYRKTELARPLWATLTPFSENWTLSALIKELEQERIAMEKRKQ